MTGKRSSVRRGLIVEATLRVIARSGVDAVTHRAVAGEARVSLASTTYYFDSKDALVQEALELVIERSTELVRRHSDVSGPIDSGRLCERLVGLAVAQLDDRGAPLVAQFELMLEAARRERLRPLAERWNSAYMESLNGLVGAGGLPQPALATEIITTAIQGALLDQLALPRADFADGYLRPLIERTVAGLGATRP